METNTQTVQQIERFLKKVSQKFPHTSEPTLLTDIHVRVTQESGDLMAFDDDDNEITRPQGYCCQQRACREHGYSEALQLCSGG